MPINQTGTYTLLTHSTLFGGSSTTEPITLAAKFTNISPEMMDFLESSDVKIKPIESEEIFKIPILETQDQIKSNSNLQFNIGITVGIVIGIAIGLVFILITRQQTPK